VRVLDHLHGEALVAQTTEKCFVRGGRDENDLAAALLPGLPQCEAAHEMTGAHEGICICSNHEVHGSGTDRPVTFSRLEGCERDAQGDRSVFYALDCCFFTR